MENVEDFFAEDEGTRIAPEATPRHVPLTNSIESTSSYRTTDNNFNNIARKINFDNDTNNKEGLGYNFPVSMSTKQPRKKKNKKSPLRSPLPEHRTKTLHTDAEDEQNVRHQFNKITETPSLARLDEDDDYTAFNADFGNGMDNTNGPDDDTDGMDDMDNQLDYGMDDIGGPDEQDYENFSPVSLHQSVSPSPVDELDDQQTTKSVASFAKRIASGKSTKRKKSKTDDSESHAVAKPRLKQAITRRKLYKKSDIVSETLREIVVKPSPLPSPPPEDGLRRSRRTKVKPLAYWRNERINYVQSGMAVDPDTTLAKDIHNIPLQTIESWVAVKERIPTVSRIRKAPSTKERKESPKTLNSAIDDGHDLKGSEWYVDGKLDLSVLDNEIEVRRTVAYTYDGPSFEIVSDEQYDDFKLASLFTHNQDSATGFMEFPDDGSKGSKVSNDLLLVFYVIQGLLEVTMGNNDFIVKGGCSFQIPPGNFYSFKNLGADGVRMFFVQTKIPQPEADDNWETGV